MGVCVEKMRVRCWAGGQVYLIWYRAPSLLHIECLLRALTPTFGSTRIARRATQYEMGSDQTVVQSRIN
jgi:hypothetical protein